MTTLRDAIKLIDGSWFESSKMFSSDISEKEYYKLNLGGLHIGGVKW